MDLVMDVMHCDSVDFSLSITDGSLQGYESLEAAAKAHCEMMGLQLEYYDQAYWFRVGDRVQVRIRSHRWRRTSQGL
jgi:hypothetical protein